MTIIGTYTYENRINPCDDKGDLSVLWIINPN